MPPKHDATSKRKGGAACSIDTGSFRAHAETARLRVNQGRHPGLHPFARRQPACARIRVNAVVPRSVWTPFNPRDRPSNVVAMFSGKSDLGRSAQPEHISPAYGFRTSPITASYIPGMVLRPERRPMGRHAKTRVALLLIDSP